MVKHKQPVYTYMYMLHILPGNKHILILVPPAEEYTSAASHIIYIIHST